MTRAAASAWDRGASDNSGNTGTGANVTDSATLGLPRVYAPSEAAEILRGLGLAEITECALRTRAYRKQVPFHLNGRRITFTIDDLREIAEGEARRPQPRAQAAVQASRPTPLSPRRSPRMKPPQQGPWRARQPAVLPVSDGSGRR